jgi:tetratricopeptide (TPR) repeat protein
MKRSPDAPVTREIGIEICQRQGLKALIAGSILRFDRNYSLTLEAINSRTGQSIAITQVEAQGKDQVLSSLSKAANEMREKLGESLALIEKFDKPHPEATTASLEALKAFSMGRTMRFSAKPYEAITLYKRAVEIDPDFVFAYLTLGTVYRETFQNDLAIDVTKKAYEMREEVSERDRFILEYVYSSQIIRDLDNVIKSLESAKSMYPRDPSVWGNLQSSYNKSGQYEKAAATARDVIRTRPDSVLANGNLARAYTRLNRFEDAKNVLKRIRQLGNDHANWHNDMLYPIAFVQNDQEAMERELNWFKGRPDEYRALELEAETAAYRGQWRRSRDLSGQAINLALRSNKIGAGAIHNSFHAYRAAELKQCGQAKILANKALTFKGKPSTDYYVVSMTAYTMAKCGEISRAQILVDELARKHPKDTLLNGIWIPVMKAEIELNKGDAKEAIKILETTKQYEHSETAYFAPQYTRGRAFLRLNENEKARIEFQKILDHRGEAPLSVRYPLAQLGLARATKDRREYEKFFEMWKDADRDLPILVAAKKEFRALTS